MEKYKHRLLGVCVLFLMAALTIGTTVSFAGNERSSSYALTIKKVFNGDMTDEVKAKAQEQVYTFRVAAQVKSGGGYTSEERIVKITGAGEETIYFDNAFKISVIEQTNPQGFTHVTNGTKEEWNVTKTVCTSSMHVAAAQATLNISKEGGKIEITRLAGSPEVTFQLEGKPFHHGVSGLVPGTGQTPSEDEDDGKDRTETSNEDENSGDAKTTQSNLPETEGSEDAQDNNLDTPKNEALPDEKNDDDSGDTDHEGQSSDEPDKPETVDPEADQGNTPPDVPKTEDPEGTQSSGANEPKPANLGEEQADDPDEPKAEDLKTEQSDTSKTLKVEPPKEVKSNEPAQGSGNDAGNQHPFDFETITQKVSGGEPVVLGSNLPQGEYTITKLRAPDGFNVLVGPRDFDVGAGKTGTVYINGSDSKITIKAPEPVNGVVRTHHYRISKNGRQVRDIVDVLSGQEGIVEHLDEGEYTIEVSETYDGFKGYTVGYPSTTVTNRSEDVDRVTTSDTRSYKGYSVKDTNGKVANQVELYRYGPLYDASDVSERNTITSNVTYQVNWGINNGSGVVRNYTSKAARPGNYNYTIKEDYLKKLVPGNGYLYFSITGVSDSAVKAINLRWREYREYHNKTKISLPKATGNLVSVNGLTEDYITIEKSADTHERGSEVKYYYTIQDSNHNPITGFTVTDGDGNTISQPTDKEDTTVMLRAGETVKISGLKAGGNYRIYESVEEAPAMGFHVTLNDTKKSVMTTGGSINITTLGNRTVEISRPGNANDDHNREYTYNIYQDGEREPIATIKLEAGQKKNVKEVMGEMLPAGSYRIQAMDDQVDGFDVTYTDSSSITSDYVRTATVTFENTFKAVKASYHVIHEYYLKDANGNYEFEGASPVFTKNCDGSHDEGDGHYSKDVHQMEVYKGNTYTHIEVGGDAYGKVVSWPKGTNAVEVPLDEGTDIPYTTGPFVKEGTGSNGTGSKDDPGTRDYAYVPLTNLTFATATAHGEDGAHEGGAQIIILRYYREEKPVEPGKYNVIHVYYKRTSSGDEWDGSSELKTVDVGTLTNENRWTTYDVSDVKQEPAFIPDDDAGVQYLYQYDGVSYGRIVESEGDSLFSSPDIGVGDGKEYRKDAAMTSVQATEEGDQIIILRYYRVGGYNVVHEYYYREKANSAEDSDSGVDAPGEEVAQPQEQGTFPLSEDGDMDVGTTPEFNGTLSDSDGYTYDYEGNSKISTIPASLGGWYDQEGVGRITQFRPEEEDEVHNYVYKDAVYGYLDKETGTYRYAPYMTGVTATENDEEIIILRYYRGDVDQPETPPDKPDKPSGGGGTPTPPKDPEIPAIPEKPTEPEPPTEPESPGGPDDPKPPTDPSRPTTLPDPNQPGSPNQVTIWENGVPTTYVKLWDPEKEKWVYIPETEVPTTGKGTPTTTTIPRISRVPKTGDGGGPWGALIAAALSGFGALRLPFWKKKDE